MQIHFSELMEFTEWERGLWRERLGVNGGAALGIGVGANGDGEIKTVGDLVLHIFTAEKHHVDRLSGRALTGVSRISRGDVEELFAFGRRSRQDLATFVASEPSEDWDVPREFHIVDEKFVTVTPRKFVTHILLHEMRHWAQVATYLRQNGLGGGSPDFLFSPAMMKGKS